MLKPQVHHHRSNSTQSLLTPQHKVLVVGDGSTCCGDIRSKTAFLYPKQRYLPIKRSTYFHATRPSRQIKAIASDQTTSAITTTKVKAVIRVRVTMGGLISSIGLTKGLDDIADLLGKSILLELVAAEVDQKTGLAKDTLKHYAHHQSGLDIKDVKYVAEFDVPKEFGEIGAVLIENEHHKEMYIETIDLKGFSNGTITINPNSWVHSKFDSPEKRVFFTNKSYLPSQTPRGLKALREKDLASLRGDDVPDGPRKKHERIYDYDVYNDLGDPDKKPEYARPVLGTKDLPYPRRCKTGRDNTKSDPLSELRTSGVYVPRDEAFSELKNMTFSAKTVYSVMHAVVPSLQTSITDKERNFSHFTSIDALFNEGVHFPQLKSKGFLGNALPRLLKLVEESQHNILRFETPAIIHRDKFLWMKDEELCRQTLSGLNPCGIHLVDEWPLKSKLDPEVYGPPESAITKELVEQVIGGFVSLEKALEQKKLFIIDYHDLLLPFVNKVREIKDMKTTLYGSRLLMFLTPTGTLRPVAIELVRPPGNGKPQWKEAFTPCWDSTGTWLWKLAKIHFLAHDAGVHQLYSHWVRSHCCTEPYIIASNRQLSAMHPIYRLLHPHFRYTMEINALARESLINHGGIIESCFSPGKYSIELSSVAYGQLWRFDQEALPADLIRRGMAEEDPNSPHGLKLTIEDYPYANDGLVLWDAIKGWVTEYVNHYYPEPNLIASDEELQAWWTSANLNVLLFPPLFLYFMQFFFFVGFNQRLFRVRSHCCTEPYIIASNRQLSAMHPIYRLLHPHFRYTMEINALARESLINHGGIIESCFSPGKYSIELSSVAYGQLWRFDQEALPADLIRRGMAEEDPNSPHGLKLTIEDYPYANDGLVLWDAIKGWVTEYVNHYYPEPNLIASDEELQAWWTEIRTLGHQDKKDEPWWPILETPHDLIKIISTIIWVTSGHHAAVNFGQYDYAGYVPGRSTIARVNMPCEDPTDERWESFKQNPEDELLATFPSQLQASQVMCVLDVLSNHSPDEEYIGQTMEPSFEANPKIKAAYEIFAGRMKELEGIIDGRNANSSLKNRNGVGIPPYQLLKPFSKPGVTGMGVPNSISI